MMKKILCLLLMVLLFAGAVPVSAEEKQPVSSYDFDLSFSLNAQSFPAAMRKRMAGYAELINRLAVKGTFAWNASAQSMDLTAVIYYKDTPSVSLPFRIYGTKAWLFCTSPLMNNEVLFFDLNGLMEYSVKVKNLLGLPLPYLAVLYPYTTEHAFSGMLEAWQNVFSAMDTDQVLSDAQFRNLSDLWMDELQNNYLIYWWIKGVAEGSDAQSVIESLLYGIPDYLVKATDGNAVTVSVDSNSQAWRDASGKTIFARTASDGSVSSSLTLPAAEYGYVPSYTYQHQLQGQTVSFDVAASVRRDPSAGEPDEYAGDEALSTYDDSDAWYEDEDEYDGYDEEYGDYTAYDEYEDEDEDGRDKAASADSIPELLFDFRASGSDLPRSFPSDSDFSLSATVLGAVIPNYTFCIKGQTKQDGAVTLTLCKPYTDNDEPVTIFQCSGFILPSDSPKDVPDYYNRSYLEDVHSVFAFSEVTLSAFSAEVLTPLVRNVISFVAAAPTSACQSFLDDLTDIGLLEMILD